MDAVFVFSPKGPKGMDRKAQGRAAHPVVGNTQPHLFPEGDASMDLRRESANMMVRVDRTLSGYKHQYWPSYTGLRCATLCSAIQPLRGKDKDIPAAAARSRPGLHLIRFPSALLIALLAWNCVASLANAQEFTFNKGDHMPSLRIEPVPIFIGSGWPLAMARNFAMATRALTSGSWIPVVDSKPCWRSITRSARIVESPRTIFPPSAFIERL